MKKQNHKWAILGVIAVVSILSVSALFMLGYMTPQKIIQIVTNNNTVVTKPSLSGMFHQQIDPYFPDFMHTAEVSCVAINGQWFDSQLKVGCFDIPSGGFDSTNCQTAPYQAIANTCNGVEGTHWTCTANNAGCYYV